MRESVVNKDATTSVRRKNWIWRVCKWPVLVGGGGLFFFGIFLIAISLPNLCGELPPPEISGPDRVSRNASVPPPLETPGTPTGSSSPPTSGTQPLLNLDDFPHLSPTMRNLAQDWLDLCAETDQAFAAITDPALRAQAAALLKNRGEINAFLNLPLEWGKEIDWMGEMSTARAKRQVAIYGGCFESAALGLYRRYYPDRLSEYRERLKLFAGSDPEKIDEITEFQGKCPAFATAIGKEADKIGALTNRMEFESYVCYQKWYRSANMGFFDFYNLHNTQEDAPLMEEFSPIMTRDEEMYCMRQMGVGGKIGVITRTFQEAMESQMKNRIPTSYYRVANEAGDVVLYWSVVAPSGGQNAKEHQLIVDEKFWKSRQQENALRPIPDTTTEEKNRIRETSQTLETREVPRKTSSTLETSATLESGK